jgi:hypothetical protein
LRSGCHRQRRRDAAIGRNSTRASAREKQIWRFGIEVATFRNGAFSFIRCVAAKFDTAPAGPDEYSGRSASRC